ncbi:MAG: guanylate kinase, partial [Desulfobacterales bacterium]|nr:guanylate kinase [Desulfobacterales bacterium]
LPPSVEELERRLKGRGTDEPAVIEKRLKNAVAEMGQKDTYQYRVVNDDLETAVNEILSIFKKELA